MSKMVNWIDAHGHLADLRWGPEVEVALFSAQEQGVRFFMQGGVGPDDWQRQLQLKAQYGDCIGLCFGLHPYWVAEHNAEDCELALDLLACQIGAAMGLGEAGLDFRPHIMKDSQERQISVFEQQLELAHLSGKPMVLHIVQAHEESLQIMDLWGVPPQRGMVHSFNGSAKKAEDFLQKGFYLSIGGPVCRPDNQRLRQAVKEMPLERLLIESDSPDQPPPAYKGQLNPPVSIKEVALAIGEIKSLDPFEILDITSENFRRLFSGSQGPEPS